MEGGDGGYMWGVWCGSVESVECERRMWYGCEDVRSLCVWEQWVYGCIEESGGVEGVWEEEGV